MLADFLNKFSSSPKRQWGPIAALVFGALAFYLPEFIVGPLVPFVSSALLLTDNDRIFVIMAVAESIVIGFVALVVRYYGFRLRDIGLARFKAGFVGYTIVGFMIYFLLSTLISTVVGLFVRINFDQAQNIGFASPSGFELALVFIGLVIIPPLAEELLFRGFIFKGLRSRLPFWAAALIVSTLFALAHGQLNVGLDVFALSLVLCYLRERTNSLWPGIMLHALKNGVAFLVLFVYTGLK